MNKFEVNGTVILQGEPCDGKSTAPVEFTNMHGMKCSVPGNSKLKIINKKIEAYKGAPSLGEHDGIDLQTGIETYVMEFQNGKDSCRFEVSDTGSPFGKFKPYQKDKKIGACVVKMNSEDAPKAGGAARAVEPAGAAGP